MQHATTTTPEDAAAMADYERALARQHQRLELAVEVLEGKEYRTDSEIIAAANVVLTYGDGLAVLRARDALRAAQERRAQAAPTFCASVLRLDVLLRALIGVSTLYMAALLVRALVG